MASSNDIPSHLNMRINPKLRYLADLAARARGKSLTDYIEGALFESFARVSLDQFPEMGEEPNVYELTPSERQEQFKRRATIVSNPLSDAADRLWSEHPFVRIQLLVVSGLDHLLSDEDRTVWDYLFSRPELKTHDGKLKMKLISEQWESIKRAALTESKSKKGGR